MSPKLYVWIFCICDVVSLVVQGAGGGMASSGGGGGGSTATSSSSSAAASASSVARSLLARATESSSSSSSSQTTGTHIMVGGIIFQLVSITFFVGCAADFAWRVYKQSPMAVRRNKPLLLLGAATAFALLLIYIRSVYRTIELLHGWTSSTMRNEKLLIGLDGAMMVPAVMIYNLIHPSHLLPKISQNINYFKPESYQMGLVNDSFENPRYEKNDNATLLDRT
ncbi:RTA1-domain-containing protein [Penicillium brevicompactum]|uniref:RTA1-domain-containing protein n=1 Tax=Penicillium brevicompactum TaxID=5074 RepID=UPI002540BA80|nr:RTA1-domain-containing protein [Penicillium brevicompactum]KAJ5348612.1 RTA1-domain-containing protein [Penicillium brevicompactum]